MKKGRRWLALFSIAWFLGLCPGLRAQDGAVPLNPHTRAACIKCHKSLGQSLGPNRTTIFSSRDEPHAVVASSCRSCHKEGKEDFWLLILPSSGVRPPVAVSEPKKIQAPLMETAPAPATISAGEGFENSHDAMDCAGCHEKPAEALKKGSATPPKFTAQGVDTFCRSCHSGVDRSHFPRENIPQKGTMCLNCHKVHGRSLLFPSLRDDYARFLTESVELNPHGGKIFCLVCHPDTPQQGQPVTFRFTGNSLRLCQRCHQGLEHHPLGVKAAPATWKMDFAKFPLEKDMITCVTCHKPPECQNLMGRENPRFLRGGPYNAIEEFCARCHEGKKFSSLNPHDQLDESGVVYQKKCLYCHVVMPNLTASAEDLKFTDTLQALCISCHPVRPHPDRDHLLPMTPEMMDTLRKYEERRMVHLPLDEDEEVTCVTCHNPHERGLLKGAAGVGADEDKRLRLTTFNEICTPCHGRH